MVCMHATLWARICVFEHLHFGIDFFLQLSLKDTILQIARSLMFHHEPPAGILFGSHKETSHQGVSTNQCKSAQSVL